MARDTILIIDDNIMNRYILRLMLERDYKIEEAENGQEALKILEQKNERIKMIFTDLIMPIMNGYETIAELGRLDYIKNIPVMVITSNYSEEVKARLISLGAKAVIPKPADRSAIKSFIKKYA